MALLSMKAIGLDWFLSKAQFHFPAVAQPIGFGPGKSKMLIFQKGLTDTLSANLSRSAPGCPVTAR
jgi:hypothetical protein